MSAGLTDEEQVALATSGAVNPYVAAAMGALGFVGDYYYADGELRSKSADIAASDAKKSEAEARKAEAEASPASDALTVLGGGATGAGLGFVLGGTPEFLMDTRLGAVLGAAAGAEKAEK